MKVWQSLMVLVGMLCLGQGRPVQAQDADVHYTIVAGDNQSGVPGTTLPIRFAVRVTNWAGEPYVGALVDFIGPGSDYCWPGEVCPVDPYDYGGFEGNSSVYTDSNGVATAPPWRMGNYPTVRVWAYARASVPPYFFTFDQVDFLRVHFTVQSTAVGVPVDNPAMLAGLGMSLALMAGWMLRRRVGG